MGKACERGICDDGSCTCELTDRIAQLESELREAEAATESAEDALTIATERYDRELLTLEGSTVRLHRARAEYLLAKERDEHAKTKAKLKAKLNNIKNLFESGRRESGHLYTALAAEQAEHKKTRELADVLAEAVARYHRYGGSWPIVLLERDAYLRHRAECEGET